MGPRILNKKRIQFCNPRFFLTFNKKWFFCQKKLRPQFGENAWNLILESFGMSFFDQNPRLEVPSKQRSPFRQIPQRPCQTVIVIRGSSKSCPARPIGMAAYQEERLRKVSWILGNQQTKAALRDIWRVFLHLETFPGQKLGYVWTVGWLPIPKSHKFGVKHLQHIGTQVDEILELFFLRKDKRLRNW